MLGCCVACATWRAAHDQHCGCADTDGRIHCASLRRPHYRPHFVHPPHYFRCCYQVELGGCAMARMVTRAATGTAPMHGGTRGRSSSKSPTGAEDHRPPPAACGSRSARATANICFTEVVRPVIRKRKCPLRVRKLSSANDSLRPTSGLRGAGDDDLAGAVRDAGTVSFTPAASTS